MKVLLVILSFQEKLWNKIRNEDLEFNHSSSADVLKSMDFDEVQHVRVAFRYAKFLQN